MKRALLMLSVIGVHATAAAYPISPVTLWDLIGDADLIVVGKVIELRADTYVPDSFAAAAEWTLNRPEGRDLARLQVVDVLKGNRVDVVDVVTRSGLICPAPGRFVVGGTVLAFLSAEAGRWQVEGLSYGTLYPEPEELPVFKQRITEALALLTRKDGAAHKQDWLVQLASQRATRWQGAYDLASQLDVAHALYDQKRMSGVAKLTDKQRSLLADGFVQEPSADASTAMIAALLRGYADRRLDAALVGAVDALLDGPDPVQAFAAISEVITRYGADPKHWLGAPDPLDPKVNLDQLRRAWLRATNELHLPRGAKVPQTRRVRGVGEDTPP